MFPIPYLWTEAPIGEGGFLALEQGLARGWFPWWEIYHLEGGEQAWVRNEVGGWCRGKKWSGGQDLMTPFPASPHVGEMG